MINLLYFARLREALGCSAEALDNPAEVGTVADIIDLLRSRGGAWGEVFAEDQTILVAVNQEMCEPATTVKTGDEVAFFPPVTGG